jgi:hypothetical protein
MKSTYTIEKVLDRLNDIREELLLEELLLIERSIDRVFETERRKSSGKSRPRKLKIQP